MSEERQWEQMTALERTLRSYLWQPTDLKQRAQAALPGHIRRKEFRQAADCQDAIRKAEQGIEQWQQLLDLYLAEFVASANPQPTTAIP